MSSDIEIEIENIKEQAWIACRDFLGGPWTKVSVEELRISRLRGGVSNSIYRCALSEDTAAALQDPKVPREVLLRIYGSLQDDREHLVREAVTFTLLSERKLGPKLYGLFPKGRLEEFIPSHCLSSDEMRLYAPSTAREMAKIHALDVPLRKKADAFQGHATKWLLDIKESLQDEIEALFMPYDECERELEWLLEEIAKTNSPVVFCHNDLQGGNILYREDTPQDQNPNLVLIDFEYASYNYREFDLAVYFNERCLDYDTPEYPHFQMNIDRLPSRQEQIVFLRAYFDQVSKEGVQLTKPVEEEIEAVLRDINIFACFSHFTAVLWGVLMLKSTETQKIGPREFAEARRMLYHKFKDQHLALVS